MNKRNKNTALEHELTELPGELRRTLAAISRSSQDLLAIVRALPNAVGETMLGSPAIEIREQLICIHAATTSAMMLIAAIQFQAGELAGLAWSKRAVESAEMYGSGAWPKDKKHGANH